MKIRVISLFLAIAMTILLIPSAPSAEAAAMEPQERIQHQIRQTYSAACRGSGLSSFNGLCGTMVSWQTYLLGIDSAVLAYDGNGAFDAYRWGDYSSGGYRVESYPASRYTLRSALNAITQNGTVDAYNILVGFQWTSTEAGSKFGHALLIQGVVDGTVYFMECFNASIGGTYYAEGEPIACSIDTFCSYYNRWTSFDGIIHFGVKNYAELCTEYPANLSAMALVDTSVRAEPMEDGNVIAELPAGQTVTVSGLMETPDGAFWYRLTLGSGCGYVPVHQLKAEKLFYDGVTMTDLWIPGVIRKSVGAVLRGTLTGSSNAMEELEILVWPQGQSADAAVLRVRIPVEGDCVTLSDKQIDRALSFRNLSVGTYEIEIRAQVENTVLENGKPVTQTRSVTLWQSEVQIVSDWNRYATVRFDGNGGTPKLDQTVVTAGATLKSLPGADREGYTLTGWSLTPDGKETVSVTTAFQSDVTLYAVWAENENDTLSGSTGNWYTANGFVFYRNADGSMPTGWTEIDGRIHYFNGAGAALSGWQKIDGSTYYLRQNGARICGWTSICGSTYYFDADGKLYSGWLTWGNDRYYLAENGAMATDWVQIGDEDCLFGSDGVLWLALRCDREQEYYLVYDRKAVEAYASGETRLLLG